MSWFYYVGRLMARIILVLFTRWEVRGRENIPGEGPLLVVANHVATADPPLLAVSIKRKAIFMAKDDLFHPRFTGYFVRSFGAFPVRRGGLDRKALRQADEALDKGLALILFPEGSRSSDGRLQPALPGSALIAARRSVPILPVGLTGTGSMKGLAWLFHRPRITVSIGPGFRLPPAQKRPSKDELAGYSDLIMSRIAELLPREYQENRHEDRKGE